MPNWISTRGFLLLVFVTLHGPSALGTAAGSAKKQAEKQLVDGRKKLIRDFKKTLKVHLAVLDGALDGVDAKTDSGIATISTVTEVFAALVTFETSVRDAIVDTESNFLFVRASVMTTLSDAGIVDSKDFPRDLILGTNGLSDRIDLDLEKEVEKVEAAAKKRAMATATRFEETLDIGVGIRLHAPARSICLPTIPSGGASLANIQFTIDVLVVASKLSVSHDGIALIAGSADSSDGLLIFDTATGSTSGSQGAVIQANGNDRWSFIRTNLAEGDYMFAVEQVGKISGFPRQSITIR